MENETKEAIVIEKQTLQDHSNNTELKISMSEKKKMERAAKEILRQTELAKQKSDMMVKRKKEDASKLRYQLMLQRINTNPDSDKVIDDVKAAESYIFDGYDDILLEDKEASKAASDMLDLKFNVVKQYMGARPASKIEDVLEEAKKAVLYIKEG